MRLRNLISARICVRQEKALTNSDRTHSMLWKRSGKGPGGQLLRPLPWSRAAGQREERRQVARPDHMLLTVSGCAPASASRPSPVPAQVGAFSRRQVRTANSDRTTHCEFLFPPLQVCEARLHVCAALLPARLLTGQVIVRLALERDSVVLFMRVRVEARLHRRIRKGVLSSIRVRQSLCSRGSCSSRLITLNASIRAERLERQAHAPSRALAVGDPRTGSTCCQGVRTV